MLFTTFYSFREDVYNGVHTLSSDTLKWVLSNTLPDITTDTQLSDITQISSGNGYTTGGETWTSVTSSQTSGVYYLKGDNVVWTATGGSLAACQYAILYNDTSASDKLIGYYDFGASIIRSVGQDLEIVIPTTTGVFLSSWN